MKKYLLIATLLAAAGTAYGSCWWTKISEQKYLSGDVVCQWKCGWGNNTKYTTTAGMGYCPKP